VLNLLLISRLWLGPRDRGDRDEDHGAHTGCGPARHALRVRLGQIGRTPILAAAMTALMAMAGRLGPVPAATLGLAFYAGGLVALRTTGPTKCAGLRPSQTA
jgi:hypothetical protein